MPFPQIRSLQQRLLLLMLLPVALLLFGVGSLGFFFARDIMVEQWNEAAILKLQRAGHHIDMRLRKPIEWIELFQTTGRFENPAAVQEWVLQRLRETEGVTQVRLDWRAPSDHPGDGWGIAGTARPKPATRDNRSHRGRIAEVAPPQHDAQIGKETVRLISRVRDEQGRLLGTLDVAVRFDYLLQDIRTLGWWQSELAGIVDEAGRYLAHTAPLGGDHKRLGEADDPLELALLESMQTRSFGTLRGGGHPPKLVSGFYRLQNAPWAIVLFAPGDQIMDPIVRFRNTYFAAGAVCILIILLLIRSVVGRMARSISTLSSAAEKVAKGEYGKPLVARSLDEIGQLMASFNTMVRGLKERDFVSNTFGRYMDQEIAKKLLARPETALLGGEKRRVAILMSDLRDFTALTENLGPEETLKLLNRYFGRMIAIIQEHQGIIVDFFGDGVLVFFDPLDGPLGPAVRQALQCAFAMHQAMDQVNAESRAEGLPEFRMGIGVNAGQVVVGNIGSAARAKYGIVGAPVNVTQRIQAAATGGEVLLTEAALRHAGQGLRIGKSVEVQLKGLPQPLKLHVVEALEPPPGA